MSSFLVVIRKSASLEFGNHWVVGPVLSMLVPQGCRSYTTDSDAISLKIYVTRGPWSCSTNKDSKRKYVES